MIAHCPELGLAIPGKLLPEGRALPVPMRPGSVLLMHRQTIHSSLDNTSDDIRWSFDLRYQPIGQPTGRPVFPGFVARSRAHPDRVLHDPAAWAQSWYAARAALAPRADPTFNRWSAGNSACA
jgi:ectoine hydroxylase-related dioxygenase (phytanoyl-CoA dioxygenase family)